MAQVDVYKTDGAKAGTMELPDALFGVSVDPELVHEAIRIQEANARIRLAQVKGRSDVRGGGRKPWRQKGTGRARHGSRRSPIWTGGGITFGPNKAKNFAKKMNKRARRKALAMVLSEKLTTKRLVIVDAYEVLEAKTKNVAALRKALPGAGSSALIVTGKEDASLVRGAQNLPRTSTLGAMSLNVRDIVRAKYLILSKGAVEQLVSHFGA